MRKCRTCAFLALTACLQTVIASKVGDDGIPDTVMKTVKYEDDSPGLAGKEESSPAKGSPLDVVAAPIPNKVEMMEMERDLAHKLHKMKELISGIHSGVDQSSKMRAHAMRHKFNRLSHVIATLAKQKEALYKDNVKLRKEMKATVTKLQLVEKQLKREAKRANDNDLKRWFNVKAGEITKFLHSNGLQHYQDPKFSPMMAGITTYGLVLIPLTMSSAYVTGNIKAFSLLHGLQSINIFECGYVALSFVSMLLLLTLDPWHAMRIISEINFTFIQLSIACLFWSSVVILVTSIVRSGNSGIRRNLVFELLLRFSVAADYGSRIWVPVVERAGDPITVPPHAYLGYLLAVLLGHRLTSNARKHAETEVNARTLLSTVEDPVVFDVPPQSETPRTPVACAAQAATEVAQAATEVAHAATNTATAAQTAIQNILPNPQLHTD